MADHEFNVIRYYLDTEVRFHLQAVILEIDPRDSNELAQKIARRYLFNIDTTTPTKLPEDLKQYIKSDPKMMKLSQKNIELTRSIHELEYQSISKAKGQTPLYDEKKSVKTKLNCEKNKLHKKYMKLTRKQHFRNIDTDQLNQYLNGETSEEFLNNILSSSSSLLISQRAAVIDMMRKRVTQLSKNKNFKLRFTFIDILVELQNRKKIQRRGRYRYQQSIQQNMRPSSPMMVIYIKNTPSEEFYRTERFIYSFCVANMSLSDSARFKNWGRANKLWNHIKCKEHKVNLHEYLSNQKPCGLCKKYILSNTDDFKFHIWKVHKMRFRDSDK